MFHRHQRTRLPRKEDRSPSTHNPLRHGNRLLARNHPGNFASRVGTRNTPCNTVHLEQRRRLHRRSMPELRSIAREGADVAENSQMQACGESKNEPRANASAKMSLNNPQLIIETDLP